MVPSIAERTDWTYDKYLLLEGAGRYEILAGELNVAPAPGVDHQRVSRRLVLLLNQYVETHRLGEIFAAPLDVVLAPDVVVQPDVVFIAAAHARMIEPRGIMGAPDMVVEIISASTIGIDRGRKMEAYERHGVREYWLVDPARRSIEVFVTDGVRYALAAGAVNGGSVTSTVIAGLTVEIDAIMPVTANH